MLHFVRVRIDRDRLPDLARALQDGTLDRSHLRATHCLAGDPEVGLSIWETADAREFETAFQPFRAYYKEVMEVAPVILPAEALARMLG